MKLGNSYEPNYGAADTDDNQFISEVFRLGPEVSTADREVIS